MYLWKYNTTTGIWRAVRDVTPETADQWLAIWQRDEPNAYFKISKNKPRNVMQGGAPNRKPNPGGRPRKYASDAEKQAAYRARYAVVSLRLEQETADTLKRIAEYLDVPVTEVGASLIKFALLNRNWMQLGLFGKRLPTAHSRDFQKAINNDES